MTPTHRRTWRSTAAVAGVTALLAAGATTAASAGPAYVEHYVDDSTVVHPDGSPDFCGDLGFDVVETTHEEGTFVLGTRGRSGTVYAGARFTGTTTWENPANGRQFRMEYAGTDRDQRVTDNGDGTVTIEVQVTGPDRYYANGEFVFLDAGLARFRIVIDQMGTPADPADDEFVEFLGLDKYVGAQQTNGRDWCADITQFLG